MDMQAIYDLVGDKIFEVFNSQNVAIMEFDLARRSTNYVYVFENGTRFHLEPRPFTGYVEHLIQTREPVFLNENVVKALHGNGSYNVPGD